MRRSSVLAGLLLLVASTAVAQEFPKLETSPAFMYIRTSPNLDNAFTVGGKTITGNNDFNCVGGGGTIAYNLTSMIGIAADLGGCKVVGNTVGLGATLTGNQFTYLFGPRLTFRNFGRFRPFGEVSFGGDRASLSCNSGATKCISYAGTGTYSKNAFALAVGGGFDVQMTKKFSLRLVQAEYLYTRFGNNCAAQVCNNNNNQNNFRLKSGFVIAWGGGS